MTECVPALYMMLDDVWAPSSFGLACGLISAYCTLERERREMVKYFCYFKSYFFNWCRFGHRCITFTSTFGSC